MVSALVRVQTLARKILLSLLRKILNSHSARSVHPDVYMGTGECNAWGNTPMDLHPNQGSVEIFLVASCYRNLAGLKSHLARMWT